MILLTLEICTPYSITACIKPGIQLGLQLGGNGTKFIGNHEIRGCHADNSSVYYGIEKKTRRIIKNSLRVGCDCMRSSCICYTEKQLRH